MQMYNISKISPIYVLTVFAIICRVFGSSSCYSVYDLLTLNFLNCKLKLVNFYSNHDFSKMQKFPCITVFYEP